MKMRWLTYFSKASELAAEMSRDPNTRVGAVIVNPESKTIISQGFNGFPRGINESPERYEGANKYFFTCHAEMNAIINAARAGAKILDASIICNRIPCIECTKAIIQAGIRQIYFQWTPDLENPDLLKEDMWRAITLKWLPILCQEANIDLFYYDYTASNKLFCVQINPRSTQDNPTSNIVVHGRVVSGERKIAFDKYECAELNPDGYLNVYPSFPVNVRD